MNVMDMLWNEAICQRDRTVADKSAYDALFTKCMALREELAKGLPDEKMHLLDALEEPVLALAELAKKDAFSYGVCIGMELQKEHDSLLQS